MMNTNLCDQFTVMVSIENLTFIRRLYMQTDRVDFYVHQLYSVPRAHKNGRLE